MWLSYPLLLVAAVLPSLPAFLAAAVLSYGSDHYLHRAGAPLLARMAKARAGLSIRFLARQMLVLLLLLRMDLPGANEEVLRAAVIGFVVFYGIQVPHAGLIMALRRKRRLPIATRNIDMSALGVPDGAPRWLTRRASEKILHTELAMLASLLAAAATREPRYAYAGAVVTLGLAFLYLLVLLPFLRPSRLAPSDERTLEWFDEWLREHRPTVALYFSGSRDSAYQVNMWLDTMEQLARRGHRPIVILRERYMLPLLATTTVPVLCVPRAVDLMNMDVSSLRVGLYPANVGKNLHLLRVPTMKHVFIGHGDSDKIASINPYAKAYDEVWAAGRAGRDRYALADVGVRDEDIVEVGRPQLAPVRPAEAVPDGRIPTVLYAPTWEGWTDDPGNTSLIAAGEQIVTRLLAADPPVRLLYKPHPFTGIRSPQARAAHQRIVALIEEATARRAAEPRWADEARRAAADRARAQATLRSIEKTRAKEAVEDPYDFWTDAVVSRDGQTPPDIAAAEERQRAEWNEAFWRSFGWWEHRVVTGAEPRLFDCFNEAHALVSDISSVVSDFIASGKPYAVTDSAGLGAEEFKRQNTAVRAAVILDNEARGIDILLAAVREPEKDPLAEARQELKEYLLGPDEPPSIDRFGAAVHALAAKAEARNQAQAQAQLQATVPHQRDARNEDARNGVGTRGAV
ncbi:hypothetical protein [Streptomyces sp. YIM 98790]|uniref:hypothetical protein n=1 Tax=Streptomyces sp. YIM 98790 TaxID=2689077 RepID=UPI001FB85AAB|nr:hypothetical protein [Streptomyces sp. YIM 98790]